MDQIEKFPLESMNITEEQKQKLKQLFPEVFTEGDKIDWDKLRLTLGESVDVGKERFGMNWPGKADCFKIIQQPSLATLVPARDESVNFDTTENLFIEGDNFEALKLLQKSYLGKIKIIYIDPPYNTGNDFIYPDNYSETLETYLAYTGQVDSEGRKFSTNTDTEGRFHSKWMNMMYPRLFLAKNLLKDDGVIFISIDDNEVDNLKKICNEIFGEENFIECITWNKRVPKNDKGIGNIHEFILIYVKNSHVKHEFVMQKSGLSEIDELIQKLKNKKVSLSDSENEIKKFYLKKGYDRGITLYNSLDENYRLWGKINLSWPNANTFGPKYIVLHPRTNKAMKIPDRGWRWKEETFKEAAGYKNGMYQNVKQIYDGTYVCGRIWFDKDENTQPSSITYLDEVETFLLRSILSLKSDGGIEVEKLFDGKSFFSYPKPVNLIKILLNSKRDTTNLIVLDFFAGSCTSSQAVLELNAEDSGNRKFICIQLPEPTEINGEANKAGYKNIADIGKERIRRVIKKIEEEQKQNVDMFSGAKPQLDLGFKVFKLSPSNFTTWNANVDKTAEEISKQLELHINHISESADQEAILYELLLKSGFELTTKIEKVVLENKPVFSIGEGELLICLERELTNELIKAMAERKAIRVICLDEGFQNNDQLKTNAALIMKTKGVVKFQTV